MQPNELRKKILEAIRTLDGRIETMHRQREQLIAELSEVAHEGAEIEYDLSHIKEFEDCAFLYKCPIKWEEMIVTEDNDVKFCTECGENVYLTPNFLEFEKRIKEKKCVAVRYSSSEDDDVLDGYPMYNWQRNPKV